MKFTPSKDGALRANLRPTLRIGRDELIMGLHHRIVHKENVPKSRRGVAMAACEFITEFGWHHCPEIDDDAWQKATDLIDNLFPELKE